MEIYSSKQIAGINHFFEPNPFNTGPPIPPTVSMFEAETVDSNGEILIPELSSSPTSTAPSSPRSFRSALSLEDPEIRKIWEDPRFGPVIRNGTPPMLNTAASFSEEQYPVVNTPFITGDHKPFVQEELTLNPLAQPFVPCVTSQDIQPSEFLSVDHVSMYYGDKSLLSPLSFRHGPLSNLRTIEEATMHPPFQYPMQFYSAPAAYEDPNRPLDPPYPPGLPHPPRNAEMLSPLGEGYVSAVSSSPAYAILIDALLPTHDNQARDTLLQTAFSHIERWDLFTLRDLTSTLMVAAFGNERDLVLPCSKKACPDHGDERIELLGRDAVTSPEDAFHQVLAGFANILRQTSGQPFVDLFLVQVLDSIFGRFISYFDPGKPDSLNTYYKTHQVPPCISYIRSAFSVCKTIAYLYQQSIIRQTDVNLCILRLLQDLMSVEHLEALRLIVLASGMELWDPPLSMLSTSSVPTEGTEGVPANSSPTSTFAFPPIKKQAKSKVCGDITMFCSKLDSYKIRRGQSGCMSLRGENWNVSGEVYKAMIKEVTDTVLGWQEALIELIDRKEELT